MEEQKGERKGRIFCKSTDVKSRTDYNVFAVFFHLISEVLEHCAGREQPKKEKKKWKKKYAKDSQLDFVLPRSSYNMG